MGNYDISDESGHLGVPVLDQGFENLTSTTANGELYLLRMALQT